MQFKDARARFDVADGDDGESGTFEAIVSVFNNVDAAGDRVMPGAFTKSIERWKASGDPVPIVYSHAHRDPHALLGGVLDMRETDEGLWVKGRLDLDSPTASLVHRHMRSRTIRKFSFAYDVLGSHPSRKDSGVTELTELDVIEVGPTLIPANPATDLVTVKAEGGQRLTEADATRLREAISALQDLEGLLRPDDTDTDAKSAEQPPPDDTAGVSTPDQERLRAQLAHVAAY